MVPSAILFDFDGVIADTENHHVAAWQRTLTTLGWQLADEVAAKAAEIDDRSFLRDLFGSRGIEDGDIEGWVRKKQELTILLLKDSPRLYPGVTSLVGLLRGKTRLAVVSGTWRENVEAVLAGAGLSEAFELIVAKEDVKQVKPEPDAYLLAIKKMGLAAADVVAIEDSPGGVEAARAANLRVVAVGHRRTFGNWVGEAVYVTGFDPPTGLLEHLGFPAC